MIRNILLYYFAFLTTSICFSQKEYEYFGGLVLNDSTSITYKLSLTENSGEVKGYSITDLGGLYETKSTVFGEYDVEKKELNFREVQTIYTKTPLGKDYDFCYVNTTIKNFSFVKNKNVKTNFIGLFEDNTPCINGELYLSLAEKIEDRMMKVKKKIDKMKRVPDSIKQKFQPLKMMDSINMNVLRKNQTLSVFSKNDYIQLIIYDGGKEDGDKITLSTNGKVIRRDHKVNNEKEKIVLSLNEDVTAVSITAINEGEISPNTAIVQLVDKNNSIKALSNLKAGETTTINIIKMKK